MAREEQECDFPGHQNHTFDLTNGARVFIERQGRIMAFCSEIAERLTLEGVQLYTHAQIHARRKEREEGPNRRAAAKTLIAQQKDFIKRLKE